MSVRIDTTLVRGQVSGSHIPNFLKFTTNDGPKTLSEVAEGKNVKLRVDGTLYEGSLQGARLGVAYLRDCIKRYGAADLIASYVPGASQRTATEVQEKRTAKLPASL